MPIFYVLLLCSTLIPAGCTSRLPEPVAHPYTQQKKSQAAEHWGILAKDVADRINQQLVLTGNADKSLFVEYDCGSDAVPCKPNETSPFNEAFRDLLITSLYELRIPTKVSPSKEALNIEFKVQSVRHLAHRSRSMQPGVITALSAGVAVLRNAPTSLLIFGTGGALDVANSSFVKSGSYEVIITTSITDREEYFFRSSDIYYINDPDFWHYMENFPETKELSFSSKTLQKEMYNKKHGPIPTVKPIPPAPDQNLAQETEARKEKI